MSTQMLAGKVVLVTGGSRGIGHAIAIACAREGASVAISYSSAAHPALEVVRELTDMGAEAVSYKSDVSDFAAAGKLVADVIEDFGHIDVLINNAGITRDKLLIAMSEEDFDDVIAVNLKGAFAVSKHAAAHMIKRRHGRIINISSVSGLMGNAGQVNYAAAKAGLIGMTKSMAKELAGRGVLCNAIAPGFIETDMTEKLSDRIKEAVLPAIPLKRFGAADDIANAAIFLASDMSSYITGEVLVVDGGLAM